MIVVSIVETVDNTFKPILCNDTVWFKKNAGEYVVASYCDIFSFTV